MSRLYDIESYILRHIKKEKEMSAKLTRANAWSIGKAALYIGVSAILGYLISLITDNPELFGVFTPIVNIILVTARQFFKQG